MCALPVRCLVDPCAEFRDCAVYLHVVLSERMLKRLWQGWKRIARVIGDFQARVLLTLIYAIVVLPFGVTFRLVSDALRIKQRPPAWLDYANNPDDMDWARRQF